MAQGVIVSVETEFSLMKNPGKYSLGVAVMYLMPSTVRIKC